MGLETCLLFIYQFVVLDFHIPQVFQGITGASVFKPSTQDILLGDLLTLVFQSSAVFAIGGKLLKELLALVGSIFFRKVDLFLEKQLFG